MLRDGSAEATRREEQLGAVADAVALRRALRDSARAGVRRAAIVVKRLSIFPLPSTNKV